MGPSIQLLGKLQHSSENLVNDQRQNMMQRKNLAKSSIVLPSDVCLSLPNDVLFKIQTTFT